ncbi:MAG: hypothetical protein DLM59_05830 [Pseudonocardiales bacterium]|nr:MAG: hypothetical protein DLM59_05830 [Pseudonocardiales bacterium]
MMTLARQHNGLPGAERAGLVVTASAADPNVPVLRAITGWGDSTYSGQIWCDPPTSPTPPRDQSR